MENEEATSTEHEDRPLRPRWLSPRAQCLVVASPPWWSRIWLVLYSEAQEERTEHAHDELTKVETGEDPHDRIGDVGMASQCARGEITQTVRDERKRKDTPTSRTQ